MRNEAALSSRVDECGYWYAVELRLNDEERASWSRGQRGKVQLNSNVIGRFHISFRTRFKRSLSRSASLIDGNKSCWKGILPHQFFGLVERKLPLHSLKKCPGFLQQKHLPSFLSCSLSSGVSFGILVIVSTSMALPGGELWCFFGIPWMVKFYMSCHS